MPETYLFADEAGDFVFKRKKGASTYFILCTVTAPAWSISDELLAIRRHLALNGDPDREKLHATSDLQEVRNRVFDVICGEDFRIDATIVEKAKAYPRIRQTHEQFYRYAWYYHFKHIGPPMARQNDKLLITAAALGERRTRAAFKAGVNEMVQRFACRDQWEVAFLESSKDPLLWVADYCAWAIQKRWESNGEEVRSYDRIRNKIATEFDLFEPGGEYFY